MAKEFTDANWESDVLGSDKVVLVDFWAEWCGPCRMVGPVVEKLADAYGDNASIGKLNVDHNPNVASTYGIRSIPTLMLFKDGQMVKKLVGVQPEAALVKELTAAGAPGL